MSLHTRRCANSPRGRGSARFDSGASQGPVAQMRFRRRSLRVWSRERPMTANCLNAQGRSAAARRIFPENPPAQPKLPSIKMVPPPIAPRLFPARNLFAQRHARGLFVPLQGPSRSGTRTFFALRAGGAHARRRRVIISAAPLVITPLPQGLARPTGVGVARGVVGKLRVVIMVRPLGPALLLVRQYSQVRRDVLFHAGEVLRRAILAVAHRGMHFLCVLASCCSIRSMSLWFSAMLPGVVSTAVMTPCASSMAR